MKIKSKCWVTDHWVIFNLIIDKYDNIITFLDTQKLLFLAELKLDFSTIPFELHGKGESQNLYQYLANNTDNNTLIANFLNYFLNIILNMRYFESDTNINFYFSEDTNWQSFTITVLPPTPPTPEYFTLQVTPQLDGDDIGFYVESPSVVTYNWGDGTVDDTGTHAYNAGTYQIEISPVTITGLQIASMASDIYSGPKFSEFCYLTELIMLAIIADASTIEDGALDNCKKLEMLSFKFGGPSQLKKSMFNNLISLTDFGILFGPPITSFESGVFEGTSIESLYFNGESFDSTTLVDQFLIDLDNSTLPNLTYITISTHRTTNSNDAVESLVIKGITVDVTCDE